MAGKSDTKVVAKAPAPKAKAPAAKAPAPKATAAAAKAAPAAKAPAVKKMPKGPPSAEAQKCILKEILPTKAGESKQVSFHASSLESKEAFAAVLQGKSTECPLDMLKTVAKKLKVTLAGNETRAQLIDAIVRC